MDLLNEFRFPAAELRQVERLVEGHVQAIRDAWDAHFNS
jgi:hypothetical protein